MQRPLPVLLFFLPDVAFKDSVGVIVFVIEVK
jgi:hypothetical protein